LIERSFNIIAFLKPSAKLTGHGRTNPFKKLAN
jgi:hypothetical protein